MAYRTLTSRDTPLFVALFFFVFNAAFSISTAQEFLWTRGPDIPTGRIASAAASVNGKLYIIGGWDGISAVNKMEVFDPATNTWVDGPAMPTPRVALAAAEIGGRLYVVGGTSTSYVDIYNPEANSWTTGPSMPTPRNHLAAAAIDGKLYVVGGTDGDNPLNTLEIFDPKTNAWTTGPSMSTARSGLAAAAIDGKLYVVGGKNGDTYQSTLEIYDPTTNAWAPGPAMPTPRVALAAAEIGGKLYALAGFNRWRGGMLRTLEVYDPAANAWTTGPAMPIARHDHVAAKIGEKLYLTGGGFDVSRLLLVFDPAANAWTTEPTMPTVRSKLAAAAIDEKLHVVGGWDGSQQVAALEIFDPETNAWTTGPAMPTARSRLAAAAVDGKLYVVGGWDGSQQVATLEIFDPETNAWMTGPAMPTARSRLAAAAIDGKLFVVGGWYGDHPGGPNGDNRSNTLEIFDPVENTWTTGPPMPVARNDFAAAAIDGKLYIVGGWGCVFYEGIFVDSYLNTMDIYDPEINKWKAGPTMQIARSGLAAVAHDEKLYVVGGWRHSVDWMEIFNPAENIWTDIPTVPTPRAYLAAAVIRGKLYAIGGEDIDSEPLDILEMLYLQPSASSIIETATWTAANSPYRVDHNVIVPVGETLTIEAGVDVQFDADVPFLVEGALRAHGTETDSVRFLKGTVDSWRGLRISGGDSSYMAYARISGAYATGAVREDSTGGGLHLYGEGTRFVMENGVIRNNGSAWSGAGIKSHMQAKGWFTDCRIVDNDAGHDGGGLYSTGLSELVFTRCEISGNTAGDDGGGLDNSNGIVTLIDCQIVGNWAYDDAGGVGNHGVNGVATLVRCLIADNTCGVDGGGIRNTGSAKLTLTHCTIAGNESADGGGIYNESSGTIDIVNSIVWGNTTPEITNVTTYGTVKAWWSIIPSVLPGQGIISADPLFADPESGDYLLSEGSPAIDAGDPDSPRDPDGTRADMGAFPYYQGNLPPVWISAVDTVTVAGFLLEFSIEAYDPNGDSLTYAAVVLPAGATFEDRLFRWTPLEAQVGDTLAIFSVFDGEFTVLDTTLITVEPSVSIAQPVQFSLSQNAPNPFNPSTTLRFSIEADGPVTLSVYDVNGRLVRTLVDGALPVGHHEVVWDARDNVGRAVASGVYVYRLTSGENVAMRRMVLVR